MFPGTLSSLMNVGGVVVPSKLSVVAPLGVVLGRRDVPVSFIVTTLDAVVVDITVAVVLVTVVVAVVVVDVVAVVSVDIVGVVGVCCSVGVPSDDDCANVHPANSKTVTSMGTMDFLPTDILNLWLNLFSVNKFCFEAQQI